MSDLIDRQQAIYAVRMVIGDNRSISVCDAIKQLPPIQPDIVMCKECKYHYQRNCPIEKYFSLDGFCSRGER